MAERSYEERLEHRRAVLGSTPTAEDFRLPAELTVESSQDALRLRGPAHAIAGLREELAKLARSQPGTEIRIESWVLRVQDEVPDALEDKTIVMPWHAWSMAGGLLADVAYGAYDSHFDFSEVGYITRVAEDGTTSPWPLPDIGVILDGPLLD